MPRASRCSPLKSPRLAAFEKAAAEGVPVYGVKDDRNAGRAWDAYEAAGKEITNG
jgi:chromosome partitioning protein